MTEQPPAYGREEALRSASHYPRYSVPLRPLQSINVATQRIDHFDPSRPKAQSLGNTDEGHSYNAKYSHELRVDTTPLGIRRMPCVTELTAGGPVSSTLDGGILIIEDTLEPGQTHVFQTEGASFSVFLPCVLNRHTPKPERCHGRIIRPFHSAATANLGSSRARPLHHQGR